MIRFRIISSTLHGQVDELLDEAGQAAAIARLNWEMRPHLKSKPCRIDWDEGKSTRGDYVVWAGTENAAGGAR